MRKPWDQWQIDMLITEYGKTPTSELAKRIGKKEQAIIQYAYTHHISAHRYWTDEETEFLVNKIGVMTAEAIAKKLGKSYRAVLDKAKRLQLGSYLDNTENLHLADVCRIVSRDKETIKRSWFRRGLTYRKCGKYTIITEQNLLKFMRENPKYWNAHDCDYYFFSRFDWFQKKYKEEREAMIKQRWGNVG